MRVFRTKKGRVYQLADKKMMEKWNPEMPLIFIGYIEEKRLDDYPSEIKKDVEAYLNEILEEVAIPKLVYSLKSDDLETRKRAAENLLEISSNNPDQLKIALPHIKEATEDKSKEVAKKMEKILHNFDKAQKRKKTAKKRSKLRKLRKQMDEIDMKFAAGELTDEEYLEKQKEYLKLKREIQEE